MIVIEGVLVESSEICPVWFIPHVLSCLLDRLVLDAYWAGRVTRGLEILF